MQRFFDEIAQLFTDRSFDRLVEYYADTVVFFGPEECSVLPNRPVAGCILEKILALHDAATARGEAIFEADLRNFTSETRTRHRALVVWTHRDPLGVATRKMTLRYFLRGVEPDLKIEMIEFTVPPLH